MGDSNLDSEETKSVIRTTDDDARRLAKELVRTARFGALAVLDPKSGHPVASRVATATDLDGTPVILTSTLSGHTAAILANPKCSLMVGEPGKGDPLAHPRISLYCSARQIERGTEDHDRLRRRYLARHPKAALYADFGDFSFYRLDLSGGSLNGGFGKAFELEETDLIVPLGEVSEWSVMDAGATAHMNEDHKDAVKLYAEQLCGANPANWKLGCIDPEGLDMVAGDNVARLWFSAALSTPGELRAELVKLAHEARSNEGE